MIWLIRAALFSGFLASACLLVLGAADVSNKRWGRAAGEIIGGLVGMLAGLVVIRAAVSMIVMQLENGLQPDDKMRVYTMVMSSQTNYSVIGFTVGVGFGAWLSLRRRKAEAKG